jgi:hypothetical protein
MIMQRESVSNDLPPASIVEACERIGLLKSKGVRWSKVSRLLSNRNRWFTHLLTRLMAARPSPGAGRCQEVVCTCGEQYVLLIKYRFTLDTGARIDYRIGQCKRCQTIHWDNA